MAFQSSTYGLRYSPTQSFAHAFIHSLIPAVANKHFSNYSIIISICTKYYFISTDYAMRCMKINFHGLSQRQVMPITGLDPMVRGVIITWYPA